MLCVFSAAQQSFARDAVNGLAREVYLVTVAELFSCLPSVVEAVF